MMRKIVILSIFIVQVAIAQKSPHGQLSIPCQSCHTTDSWSMRKDAAFSHDSTGFKLVGRHKSVQCASCHQKLGFAKRSSDCTSCHTDVHRGELGLNCLRCHTMDSWIIPDIREKHQQTRFPLLGRHASALCEACHSRPSPQRYVGTPSACIACHRSDFQAAANPSHVAANFSTDCVRCHTASAMRWSSGFDHNLTAFPLTGAHRAIVCSQCHMNNQFAKLSTNCYGCHQRDFAATQSPNHLTGNFSHDCQSCHTTTAWQPATFDHNSTRFPLTGEHRTLQCESCHKNGNYQLTFTDCYQCHQADFQNSTNPNHQALSLSHDCVTCHTTSGWQTVTFDHNTTKFPLAGAHASIQCQTCHANTNYKLTFTDCYQCHQVDFQQPTDPNHVSANFSHDCVTCHTTTAWRPAVFDHNTTKFSLTGKHRLTQCQTCHTNGNYQLSYTNCYQCHQSNFESAINPNHVAGNFSRDCQTCHSTTDWSSSTFDHNATAFPLTGSHTAVLCQTCHVNNNYQLTFSNCYQCHQADFQRPTDPNHVSANFSHDCLSCHTTTAWKPAAFDHNSTGFPLSGKHRLVDCQTCHTNGNYQLRYSNCYQCHQADYQNAINPNHVSGNFSRDCQTCHSTTDWSSANFDHNTTAFPLTGSHMVVLCQTCHVNNNYQLRFTDCYQCHQADFQRPTDPNHVTANFSHNCLTCHTTTAWTPAVFDHNTTNFPFTGKHRLLQCQLCHTNSNYQLAYSNCYQCHQPDYQNAINPNHVTANFSHDCQTCHTTTAWSPATFDHSITRFPLTGAHTTVQCQTCHANGNYQLAYSDCYQCHQANYQSTTNPNHVAGNFSHDCQTCHTTAAWSPATFDHNTTRFPLTGAHTSLQCQTCHVNGNYQLTFADCYQCHQPDFQNVTNPNHVAGNFSHDCQTCHTTAAWSPATFDHNSTRFPLTGAHTPLQCQTCHVNGNYQLTFTNCYQCHQTDYQNATNPNHVTGNFSQNCTTCHNTTAWQPATFDHSATRFPLTGAHTAQACQACHTNGNYQLVYTNCVQCHSADFASATTPVPHTGFSTDCTTCHTTTAWSPSTFSHANVTPRFPRDSRHNGAACAKCHQTPTNYTIVCCQSSGCHNTCAGGDD